MSTDAKEVKLTEQAALLRAKSSMGKPPIAEPGVKPRPINDPDVNPGSGETTVAAPRPRSRRNRR